jgi:hypothetical protein
MFLFKRHLAVMLLLVVDLFRDNSGVRNAHAESAVSFLPSKSASMFVHPFRGIGFEELNGLGERGILREMKQDVRVVRHAIDGDCSHPLVAADAGHVRPQLGLDGFGDSWEAAFCAEDKMNVVLNEGVRHGSMSPFQGSHSITF